MESSYRNDDDYPAVASVKKIETLRQVEKDVEPHPAPLSIRRTSSAKLAQASEEAAEAAAAADKGASEAPLAETVFYLAYGSNLSAETFLGVRGIRPLSQVNVTAPTLRLTLSLPGIPYTEPCFANVDFRKLPEKPKLPDPRDPTPGLPINPPPDSEGSWDGELIGVAYEVTKTDYSKIIATEGGGASYKEIVVPCIPIPPRFSVPEHSPIPELPKPILCRTLYAPYLPDNDQPDDPRKKRWWYRLVLPTHRPDPDYAQASARYLKLITDGAREHELPDGYQEYLQSLRPFRLTTLRQKIGAFLHILVWGPAIMSVLAMSRVFADKNGRMPPILATSVTVLFNIQWLSYDKIAKPLFGEGERTEEDIEGKGGRRRIWIGEENDDEEKSTLLRDTE